MRKIILLALLLSAAALPLRGAHIIGGELYYDHIAGSRYQVTLKLYRDCASGGAPFDPFAPLGIFRGRTAVTPFPGMVFPGSVPVPITGSSPCLVVPQGICVELATYTIELFLPPNPEGYTLTYQRCCRPPGIQNIRNSTDWGITCTVRIPPVGQEVNSSPRFDGMPPTAMCIGEPFEFDHTATDPDGDSLVYVLTTPFHGGSQAVPDPTPGPPDYLPVPWANGFSELDPLATIPPLTIDPRTGRFTVTPTRLGHFNLAFAVREYRDGILLSEVRRDLRYVVVACSPVIATVPPQTQADLCRGLTQSFGNAGASSANWYWDFGVEGIDTDTSHSLRPSFTYPAPGDYWVTVVSNPDLPCADTATALYRMYHMPTPVVQPTGSFCGDLDTLMVAGGTYYTDASIRWDLSSAAEPSQGSGATLPAFFAAGGTYSINLTIEQAICSASAAGVIVVHPVPEAGFSVAPGTRVRVGTRMVVVPATPVVPGSAIWTVNGTPWSPAEWLATEPGVYRFEQEIIGTGGCMASYGVDVTVYPTAVVVPNVFSPNGDGVNDRFVIPYVELYQNTFSIYNRWGMEVFTANNYHGQWTGADLPEGTYYYVLHLEGEESQTGHVTLLR